MEQEAPRGKRPAPAVKAGHVVGEENVGRRLDMGPQQLEVDDEKVEEFFELMRNIQQMRGVWKGQPQHGPDSNKKKPKVDAGGANPPPPWKPAFRLEDFGGGAQEDRGTSTEEVSDRVGSWKSHGERRMPKVPRVAGEDGKLEGEDEVMMVVGMRCRAGTANGSGVGKEPAMTTTTAKKTSSAITTNLDLRLAL